MDDSNGGDAGERTTTMGGFDGRTRVPVPGPARTRRAGPITRGLIAAALAAALATTGTPAAAQTNDDVRASPAPPTSDGAPARATAGARLRLEAVRAPGDVRVDGVLDEETWRRARAVELPWEVSPADNGPSRVRTVCLVAYDDDRLLFGCRADDPDPDAIRAFVTDRDGIGEQDRIVLTLDPFNDARRAFEFGVSPLGVQWDAVYNPVGGSGQGDTGPSDPSWDAIWESAGRITEDGYVVEASIPFESLRFPAREGPQTWGFFVSRRRPRGDDVDLRSMHWDRSDACVLCQANLLTGLEDVEPGGALQLTPTVTATRTDARPTGDGADGGSGLRAGSVDPKVGVDGSWRITSDLTLNATVNPDFSQVEADAPQLDVNTRFSLFFPEKRPFFLEGADLWSTPVQAVFTRTIRSPVAGAKLSGKSGANAVGLFVTRDRENGIVLPGPTSSSSTELDGGVTNVMGRWRRDVGASSTVGVLATAREGRDYHNRVAGADAFLRLGSASTLNLQYLHSRTEYPDAVASEKGLPTGDFGGHAFGGVAEYRTREWAAQANTFVTGEGFRADAGFVNQVDLAHSWAWVNRSWFGGDDAWWTSVNANLGFWSQRKLSGGAPVTEGLWTTFNVQGPLQSRVYVNPQLARESVGGETFEYPRVHFGATVRPGAALTVRLNGTAGGGLDFANEREARQLRLQPMVDLRVGRNVDLGASWSFQRLSHEGDRIFHAHVGQLRAVYNFSNRAYLRGIVQYRAVDRNPSMWVDDVDPESTSVASQVLFSYKLNPLSVVFLGYSDRRLGGLGSDGVDLALAPTERSFFLKLGYAWRP